MINVSKCKLISAVAALAFGDLAVQPAIAGLYINEVYFDPAGSSGDFFNEYIELRGTPGISLANTYLVMLEAEDNAAHTGSAGTVEMIFDLGINSGAIGSNGFLTLRQKGSPYSVAPGTTDRVNTGSSLGYGSGSGSSIGAQDQGGDGTTENSGFTTLLIRNNGGASKIPQLGNDLDTGNNGLDNPNGRDGWEILDSIGFFSDFGEAQLGRLYGKVNYGPEATANVAEGTYVGVGYEIEYIGRLGDTTGQTQNDWFVANLTDNSDSADRAGDSGFREGDTGFRISADPHASELFPGSAPGIPEVTSGSTRGILPYGFVVTNNLGATNVVVPEPASLCVLMLSAVAALRRVRRR